MLKNIVLKIVNVISILLIVGSLGVLLTVVLTKQGEVPDVFGYSLFRIMTGSMEPTMPVDSLIVVQKVTPEELRVGDVISFYSRDPSILGQVNTHRIIEIEENSGSYQFYTKGDANNIADQHPVLQGDVIGRVVKHSYGLGKFIRLISNPLIFIPIIIIPLTIMLGHSVWESIKLAKQLAKEEEEQAVREAIEALRQKKED